MEYATLSVSCAACLALGAVVGYGMAMVKFDNMLNELRRKAIKLCSENERLKRINKELSADLCRK